MESSPSTSDIDQDSGRSFMNASTLEEALEIAEHPQELLQPAGSSSGIDRRRRNSLGEIGGHCLPGGDGRFSKGTSHLQSFSHRRGSLGWPARRAGSETDVTVDIEVPVGYEAEVQVRVVVNKTKATNAVGQESGGAVCGGTDVGPGPDIHVADTRLENSDDDSSYSHEDNPPLLMPVPTAGDFIGPIAVSPLAPGVALEMDDLEFVSKSEIFQLLIPTIRAGTLNRLHSSGLCAGRTKQLGHVELEHIRCE